VQRILIITNRIPYPLNDGGNLAMHAMVMGYHNAGWEVYLLAMNTVRHYVDPSALHGRYDHLDGFEWVDFDNQVRPLPLVKNLLFSKQPEHVDRFYRDEFEQRILKIIHAFKPNVVQIESVYLTTYLPAIKQHSNALTILRVHNIEYHVWHTLARTIKNPLKKLYFKDLAKRIRKFEKRAWTKYDLLMPITAKDASLIERVSEVKAMMVASFGVSLHKPARVVPEQWNGYHIGAMDWIPNRDGIKWFLDKVWPMVARSKPEFEFFFAGRNMPDSFTKLAVSGVHCLSEVPSADDFIADKKILIVPLWSGSGIRVKILEAMAAGKVVITTVAGIKGIDAKPQQHYLLANDPEDFVKAIVWCLDHKDEAQAMAMQAQNMVMTHYEQGVVIRGVIPEVEKLLQQHLQDH